MSIFTMEDVNVVIKLSVKDAKAYAFDVISKSKNAKPVTIMKAKNLINRSRTSNEIAFGMSSWILAHPDESLKVI